MSTYVLVHGIAHGAWCWEGTREELERAGHEVLAVDLPLTSLDDDAAVVTGALDLLTKPAILVGHSYGGLVISRAAGGRDDVRRLAYVAALLLESDEVATDFMAQYPPVPLHTAIQMADDATFTISPEDAVVAFYAECDPAEAAAAAARLRPSALACLAQAPGAEPWRDVPTTYMVCRRDGAVHPDSQVAMSARATTTVTFDTDHSPFLSMREPFVDTLLEFAD